MAIVTVSLAFELDTTHFDSDEELMNFCEEVADKAREMGEVKTGIASFPKRVLDDKIVTFG